MKLIRFVVALCVAAICVGGEESAKSAEDKKAVVDAEKEFAAIKAELKLLRDENDKQVKENDERKKENKELRQEMARQKRDAAIQTQEEIAKARVKFDQEKIAIEEQKIAMEKEKSEIDAENVKLVELVKEKTVKQSKRQNDVVEATRKLIRSEIKKYNQAHNESLKRIIDSEIQNYLYSTAETKLLNTINGNGRAGPNGGNTVSNFFNSDGTCSGYVSGGYVEPFPQFVWYEFSELHIPARMSFTRTGNNLWLNWGKTPKSWEFVGTTDAKCDHSSNWVSLCGDLSGSNYAENAVISCDIPKFARKPYKCLAIRINSNQSNRKYLGSRSDNLAFTTCTCFKELKFWEVL